ncbi:MAG: BamA/TamA family outer membrane protein [Cyclobacteriaceae bacterium]|nr:BamA/TamA family outer membrane protein [Cyclobacteriaceae bacterium]
MHYLLAIVLFFQQPMDTIPPINGNDIASLESDTVSSKRFVEIGSVFIVGNNRTKSHIITREMKLQPGEKIFLEDLNEQLEIDQRNIYNTLLFNSVKLSVIELSYGQVDIVVRVSERWYLFPSPYVDLIDRNFNDWWQNENHDFKRITYGVKLYQKNFRGRNETVKITALTGFTKTLSLDYLVPFIDKRQKTGMEVRFLFAEHNTVSYQTVSHKRSFLEGDKILFNTIAGNIGITHRESFYNAHKLVMGYRKSQITDTIFQLNQNFFNDNAKDQQYFSLQYSFRRDRRDIIAYPLNGYFFEGMLTKYGLGILKDLNFSTFYGKFSNYLDLNKGFYLSNNVVLYSNTAKNLPYHNVSGLGYGQNFVRGFELYVIEGKSYVLNRTNFKKRLFSVDPRLDFVPMRQFQHMPMAVYLKSYFDMGYVQSFKNYESGLRYVDRLIYGTGIGLDIVTAYDVVSRIEFSVNSSGESGIFFHMKKEF